MSTIEFNKLKNELTNEFSINPAITERAIAPLLSRKYNILTRKIANKIMTIEKELIKIGRVGSWKNS